MQNNKTPEIRFKRFTDDWEQRKLSDCAGFRRGSFPQPYGNKDWYDGEGAMPFVQVADVSSDMRLVKDTKQKISKLAQPMSIFAEKGSVLVTLQGSIGRVAITQYGAFVDRTVLIFNKYKDDIDKRFWAYIIKEKFEDEAKKAPGGTIKTITKEVLSDFNLMLPCYAEQSKVADYLISLDNLITLHQRKHDKLISFKKAMLEKMFPKENEKVPEIRFQGFTDDWEQRKFGNLFSFLQNNTLSRSALDNENGRIQTVHYGDVLIKFGECLDVTKEILPFIREDSIAEKYKDSFLQNGDIIIADTAEDETVGKCTEIVNLSNQKIIAGLHTMPVRSNENFAAGYLGFYLNSDSFHNQLKPLMQGTKVTSISKRAIQDTVVKYPLALEEQQEIGKYFWNLDNLITLHQCKLEKLKNIKKSMLEKMFV